jgi:hypothetical protein
MLNEHGLYLRHVHRLFHFNNPDRTEYPDFRYAL